MSNFKLFEILIFEGLHLRNFDEIIIIIYLFLTAIGLTPGGSSTVHIVLTPGGSSTIHIYTQTVHRIQRTERT
jgi:hypothetical protein